MLKIEQFERNTLRVSFTLFSPKYRKTLLHDNEVDRKYLTELKL